MLCLVFSYYNNPMLSRKFYISDILKLAFPIILGNLGFIMIGVGDVVVAGRHSTDTLAAISLATAITNCIMIFGIGILGSISAVLSNYRGDNKNIQNYFLPSLKFSLILALFISSIIFCAIPLIDKLGFEQKLVSDIKNYLFVTGFATFGGYLHFMAKEYLQSFEIVLFPNLLTIACIVLNVGLNIMLVFGCGRIPSLGAPGLAIASLITRYFMGIVLLLYCVKLFNFNQKNPEPVEETAYYKGLLKVGLPASFAILIEFTAFNVISLIMGRISGVYAAVHNIMCTLTSVSFMVPLAISNATAVKVGYANGAKYFSSLKNYAFSSLRMSVIFMTCCGILVGIFAHPLLNLFTNDTNLISIAVPIAYLLCLFQVFDGLQVSLAGIFKGLKRTSIVMVANVLGHWVVALPVGCILGLYLKLNLFGFWCGLLLSSVLICFIMLFVLKNNLKKLV